MQAKIDDRFGWLTQHLEGTGENLLIVTTCLMHAGYFLLATLCILFLNAPIFSRLVLLILVPVNAWSEINIQSSLSFGSLSSLLTLALLGKYEMEEFLSYAIPFTGKHEPNELTCSPLRDFIAQLVRALHRHRRGHGFESR